MAIRHPSLSVIDARRLAMGEMPDQLNPREPETSAPLLPIKATSDGEARVQVFLSARVPVPGVSWVFDQLCLEYRPTKALQMILRRALDDVEPMLRDGIFAAPPVSYSAHKECMQTSRMIPVSVLAVARKYFDPLGMENDRVFGRKLASAALSHYFCTNKSTRPTN